MRQVLSIFIVLLFVAGCGGGSGDTTSMPTPENSPDFEEIEIPTEFTPEDLSSDSELDDVDLVPKEMIEMVKDALTMESARTAFVRRIREASFCNALDDVSDEEIWNEVVDQFNLDMLDRQGSNLEEAIRNALAYDLNLDFSSKDESDFYGDTVEGEEFWSILADEVDGLDTEPGECS